MSGSQSQIDADALQELLRAATEVETEVKAALDGDGSGAVSVAEAVDAPSVEELAAQVALLQDQLAAFTSSAAPGADPAADFEADPDDDLGDPALSEGPDGLAAGAAEDAEFDPTLLPEAKALGWALCSGCGSDNADVYDDGTARCEDCGTPLVATEAKADGGWEVGVDFDEPDDEPGVDVKELASAVLDVYQALGEVLGGAAELGAAGADAEPLSELELLMARRESLST